VGLTALALIAGQRSGPSPLTHEGLAERVTCARELNRVINPLLSHKLLRNTAGGGSYLLGPEPADLAVERVFAAYDQPRPAAPSSRWATRSRPDGAPDRRSRPDARPAAGRLTLEETDRLGRPYRRGVNSSAAWGEFPPPFRHQGATIANLVTRVSPQAPFTQGGCMNALRIPRRAVRASSSPLLLAVPTFAAGPPPTSTTPPRPAGHSAGEPSIGVKLVDRQGDVSSLAADSAGQLRRLAPVPATRLLADCELPADQLDHLDPISRPTRRPDHLRGAARRNTSLMAMTDDDGATCLPSAMTGITSGVDHQTVGAGSFAAWPLPNLVQHIVYYCSQNIAYAACAASLTGGLTFKPGDPDLHRAPVRRPARPRQGGAGRTAYVPNKSCNGGQGWRCRPTTASPGRCGTIPGSSAGTGSDPRWGSAPTARSTSATPTATAVPGSPSRTTGGHLVGAGGRGRRLRLQNSAFPAVVGATATAPPTPFLGIRPRGPTGSATVSHLPGRLHLYVATTTNGGASWTDGRRDPG